MDERAISPRFIRRMVLTTGPDCLGDSGSRPAVISARDRGSPDWRIVPCWDRVDAWRSGLGPGGKDETSRWLASTRRMPGRHSDRGGSDSVRADEEGRAGDDRRDVHSFSNPEQVRVRHLDLDLSVDFDRKELSGVATIELRATTRLAARRAAGPRHPGPEDPGNRPVRWREAGPGSNTTVGQSDPILGEPLTIPIKPDSGRIRIRYRTSPSRGLAMARPRPDGRRQAAVPVHAVARRSTPGRGSRSRTRRGCGSPTRRRSASRRA